jgi:hypothetical protein
MGQVGIARRRLDQNASTAQTILTLQILTKELQAQRAARQRAAATAAATAAAADRLLVRHSWQEEEEEDSTCLRARPLFSTRLDYMLHTISSSH